MVGKVAPPALPDAEWTTWTWQEYYDESCQIAKALMAVGMEQHSSANIFGFNSPEWFMAEMGAIIAGGKAAGIYPTDTAEQIAFKAAHSGASVAFLEDESKLAKFTIAAKSLPELKAIVCWVRAHTYIHTYIYTYIHIYTREVLFYFCFDFPPVAFTPHPPSPLFFPNGSQPCLAQGGIDNRDVLCPRHQYIPWPLSHIIVIQF